MSSNQAVSALVLLFAASSLLSHAPGTTANLVPPLTKVEKQAILDAHNALRVRTARGETAGQPQAADMMLMEWDERLSEKAAVWAASCQVGHDTSDLRQIPGHQWVGQNWAGGPIENLTYFIQLWFDEYTDFTFPNKCPLGKMCGHYTQVVWARTQLVGCASARCKYQPRTLVCNYAPGGNMGTQPPYAVGAPGTQCPAEFAYTDGIFCRRKEQCRAGVECRCAPRQCQNGGTMDTNSCRCNCKPDFLGFHCEQKCADSEDLRELCPTDPEACKTPNGQFLCQKTCGQCKAPPEIGDKNAVNPDGVEGRIP